MLVLTHDNRDISYLMNEEDNLKITNTWEILSKDPNYKSLAQDIYMTSLTSKKQNLHLSQTSLEIVQQKTSKIYTCLYGQNNK